MRSPAESSQSWRSGCSSGLSYMWHATFLKLLRHALKGRSVSHPLRFALKTQVSGPDPRPTTSWFWSSGAQNLHFKLAPQVILHCTLKIQGTRPKTASDSSWWPGLHLPLSCWTRQSQLGEFRTLRSHSWRGERAKCAWEKSSLEQPGLGLKPGLQPLFPKPLPFLGRAQEAKGKKL